MRTYYVYMLLCSDVTYYTGVTNNIISGFINIKQVIM